MQAAPTLALVVSRVHPYFLQLSPLSPTFSTNNTKNKNMTALHCEKSFSFSLTKTTFCKHPLNIIESQVWRKQQLTGLMCGFTFSPRNTCIKVYTPIVPSFISLFVPSLCAKRRREFSNRNLGTWPKYEKTRL